MIRFGTGGKMPAPNEVTIRSLQNYVTDYHYHMGVATDGDEDRIGVVDDFGEKCYEVPVGFKYISAKMKETGATIGGESSGGLTVM